MQIPIYESQKSKEELKQRGYDKNKQILVRGMDNIENSESALIDMNDKAIAQEGNYTVCSDQNSDSDSYQQPGFKKNNP